MGGRRSEPNTRAQRVIGYANDATGAGPKGHQGDTGRGVCVELGEGSLYNKVELLSVIVEITAKGSLERREPEANKEIVY